MCVYVRNIHSSKKYFHLFCCCCFLAHCCCRFLIMEKQSTTDNQTIFVITHKSIERPKSWPPVSCENKANDIWMNLVIHSLTIHFYVYVNGALTFIHSFIHLSLVTFDLHIYDIYIFFTILPIPGRTRVTGQEEKNRVSRCMDDFFRCLKIENKNQKGIAKA